MTAAETKEHGTEWRFGYFENELSNITNAYKKYFVPKTSDVVRRWRASLDLARHKRDTVRWELDEADPLTTVLSDGKSHPSGRAKPIYAAISSIWEIMAIHNGSKSKRSTHFRLLGIASTRVRLLCADTDEQLACWNFDVGAADSPGCYFHAQVPWGNLRAAQYDLDVPRFPSLITTPFDAIEFVLAELFQEEWPKFSAKSTNGAQGGSERKKRLQSLLQWQLSCLKDYSGNVALTHLKSEKPPVERGLFR